MMRYVKLPGVKHGTRTGYVRGCKCDECTDADARYQREYRRRWRARKDAQAEVDRLLEALRSHHRA